MKEIKFCEFDLNDRTLFLNGEVDELMFRDLNEAVKKLVCEDETIAEQNQRTITRVYSDLKVDLKSREYFPEINIIMNSPGGIVYDGLAICDLIKRLDKHAQTNIICTGRTMSMGVPILLSVDKKQRKATENATFMIHQVSGGMFGKIGDMEERIEEIKRLNDVIFNKILKETDIPKKLLEKNYNQKEDWFLTAEEAKKYGLISEII